MTELDPGVTLISAEVESRNGISWKEYTFDIDGEVFPLEGPLLHAQPELFDQTEDLTPEDITTSVGCLEGKKLDLLKQKWTTLKFDMTVLALGNAVVSPVIFANSEGQTLETMQTFGAVDSCALALIGSAAVIHAKKKQREADKFGKLADNFKRTQPYFESLITCKHD